MGFYNSWKEYEVFPRYLEGNKRALGGGGKGLEE